MEISDKRIDDGKAFDWGKTSKEYAKFRDISPEQIEQAKLLATDAEMKIGIIGYGSMGRMLVEKLSVNKETKLFVYNRTSEKLKDLPSEINICSSNSDLASKVVYEKFPAITKELFENTLEKRRQTSLKAEELFG